MPKIGGCQSFSTARRTIAGFEAMLWLRKGFGFTGDWIVNDQNDLLARLLYSLGSSRKADVAACAGIYSAADHSAVDHQFCSGHKAAVRSQQEEHDCCDLFRLGSSAQGCHGAVPLKEASRGIRTYGRWRLASRLGDKKGTGIKSLLLSEAGSNSSA